METKRLTNILNTLDGIEKVDSDFNIAAVLVLITKNLNYGNLVLTKRSETLRRHGGEMSFPGGVMDTGDGNLKETALRETFEEINVSRDQIDIIGSLSDISTSTGYLIRPFVAILKEPYKFSVNTFEVSDIVEVPMVSLLRGDCDRNESVLSNQYCLIKKPLYVYKGNIIFGATARILNELLSIMESDCKEK
jgi:8-oxo-dGTP pyrophosphatase MutT (NUDIX family)